MNFLGQGCEARESTSALSAVESPIVTLVQRCAFREALSHPRALVDELTTNEALYLAVAAQHLGKIDLASSFARAWSQCGEHISRGPLVSIVIPTHNRPASLARAIQSVCQQHYRPLEIVVVNDAGDCVQEVVRAEQERYTDEVSIKLVNSPRNVYLAAARNLGLAEASGKWVGYLDDDDELYPYHVGHLVYWLTLTKNRSVHSVPLMHRGHEHQSNTHSLLPYSTRGFSLKYLLEENVIPVNAVLHERSLLDEIGLFDSELRANEDWDLWIRMAAVCDVYTSVLPTCYVRALTTNRRMSEGSGANFAVSHAAIFERYRELTLKQGGTDLIAVQRFYVEHLRDKSYRYIQLERRAAIIVLGATKESREQSCLELQSVTYPFGGVNGSASTWAVYFAERNAHELIECIKEIRQEMLYDYIALVDADETSRLSEFWLTGLMMQLEADSRAFVALPNQASPGLATPETSFSAQGRLITDFDGKVLLWKAKTIEDLVFDSSNEFKNDEDDFSLVTFISRFSPSREIVVREAMDVQTKTADSIEKNTRVNFILDRVENLHPSKFSERPLLTILVSDQDQLEVGSVFKAMQAQWQREKIDCRVAIVGNQSFENLTGAVQLNGLVKDIGKYCAAGLPDWKILMPWIRELMSNRRRLQQGLPVDLLCEESRKSLQVLLQSDIVLDCTSSTGHQDLIQRSICHLLAAERCAFSTAWKGISQNSEINKLLRMSAGVSKPQVIESLSPFDITQLLTRHLKKQGKG